IMVAVTSEPPSIIQIATSPVLVFNQMMSPLPLPSKSPTPPIVQFESETVTNDAGELIVGPFINHIAFSPVVLFRHRRSLCPSASKSPRRTPPPASYAPREYDAGRGRPSRSTAGAKGEPEA